MVKLKSQCLLHKPVRDLLSLVSKLPLQGCSLGVKFFSILAHMHLPSPIHIHLFFIIFQQPNTVTLLQQTSQSPLYHSCPWPPGQLLIPESQRWGGIPGKENIPLQRPQSFAVVPVHTWQCLGLRFVCCLPLHVVFKFFLPGPLTHSLQPRSQFRLLPQENALPLRPTAGVGLSALPSGLDGFIRTATVLHLEFLRVQHVATIF